MEIAEIERLNEEELGRFYELYMNHCTQNGLRSSMGDFMVWYQENYA